MPINALSKILSPIIDGLVSFEINGRLMMSSAAAAFDGTPTTGILGILQAPVVAQFPVIGPTSTFVQIITTDPLPIGGSIFLIVFVGIQLVSKGLVVAPESHMGENNKRKGDACRSS